MQGLELCEAFYREHGVPMLTAEFPDLLPYLAIGLLGSGSECFGYDDALSRDHDFEPGFCLLLPDESIVDSRAAFRLERAYDRLPREFMGVRRSPVPPVGARRHGVIRIADFLEEHTGTADGRLSLRAWLSVPEQALAEVTNGRLFRDDFGLMTQKREALATLPEAVRRKKLAGELLLLGQAGQYNYPRCLLRGDLAAAQLAIIEFARAAMHAAFLLERRYLPYYKWCFRALRALPLTGWMAEPLYHLISCGNEGADAAEKQTGCERITAALLSLLREEGLSHYTGDEPEGHAHAVNDSIREAEIRNLPLLAAV